MLQKINGRPSRACKLIKDIEAPAFFSRTLEFSPPARGTWNIVHTGFTVPEAHQIYICAAGCLRGVVLTAAERGAMDRFSTIELLEKDLLRTDNERLIIDGVSDILQGLPRLPRAVLVFTACFHHFMGTDLNFVYAKLREKFPSVDFAACIMDPIRQTRSLTPEERLRREIYRLWRPLEPKAKHCNIIANNLPTDKTSELITLLTANGWQVHDMPRTQSYDEFLQMAASPVNIYYSPFGHKAARDLTRRHGQTALYLPQYWRYDDIRKNLQQLADFLTVSLPDYRLKIAACELALTSLRELIGTTEIAIDCTFTFCPFNLARMLIEHGFNVTKIYADNVLPDEQADFDYLQKNNPRLEIWSVKNPDGRVADTRYNQQNKVLCLGQKAAWFNANAYFIPWVEGGGHYGLDGILQLVQAMSKAFLIPKDTQKIISQKGFGGCCCL